MAVLKETQGSIWSHVVPKVTLTRPHTAAIDKRILPTAEAVVNRPSASSHTGAMTLPTVPCVVLMRIPSGLTDALVRRRPLEIRVIIALQALRSA